MDYPDAKGWITKSRRPLTRQELDAQESGDLGVSMFRFDKTTFDEVLRKVTPHFRGRSVKMANLNNARSIT